jgi:hypothetical protein
MSNDIVQSIAQNDLDTAKTAVLRSLSEKAAEALQARKQEVASQYFAPKAE